MEIYPMGDSAIVIQLGTEIAGDVHERVRVFAAYLEEHPFPGMVEYVPAFTTVTIFYDPVRFTYSQMEKTVCSILEQLSYTGRQAGTTIRIPVCYGGKFGPDLNEVAVHHGMTVDEVISIHTGGEYLVYMIGFAPGFPYLGGMSQRIATPRRSSPRLVIPAGTVGIAGTQTGVYPIETPGGWQLIGRTPLPLFRPNQHPPSLLAAGDIVQFYQISEDEFIRISKGRDEE